MLAFVREALFLPFGVVTGDNFIPALTQISHNECLIEQSGQSFPPTTNPGWLCLQGTVQFLTLPKK